MLETIQGDQSVYRFMLLDEATVVRPANFEAAALTLPELTSTDIPKTVSTKSDPVTRMYGSPRSGSGELDWAKPRPDQASWTGSLTGNVMPTDAQRAAMETIIASLGKYVWMERVVNTDTTAKGGCALVTSTGEPVPADGVVTFSVGLTGYGPRYENTALATG